MKEINRQGITYRQLPNGTLTCGPLDQSGMVGGTGEYDRNYAHNPERLHRILQLHRNPKVLDYGCGSGILVEFLLDNGIDAKGHDRYGKDDGKYFFNREIAFPPKEFDVVTMIEVIEHTAAPFTELEWIFQLLKPGGILMVETSFTDWMDPETDPYINPSIGHSTIFSHRGLNEVMEEKGFEVYGHINRNVRLYKKPEPPFDPKITLITMGQGNPIALKRTIESFKDIVDEIVFGDLLIFDQDREIICRYTQEYNFRMVKLPFNYIFQNGFAATLNQLAEHATHDWILYMNVAEIIDGEHYIKEQMSRAYNCYSFDHVKDEHRWFRLYNRKEVLWANLIHEELTASNNCQMRRCPFNIFRMKDTEKDQCPEKEDEPLPFYAKVCNDVKEMTYWNQFVRIMEHPELRANTNDFWLNHAQTSYESHQERMAAKGKRHQAFAEGNLSMYLEDIYTNPEFEKERFESSTLINFQGMRKDIL